MLIYNKILTENRSSSCDNVLDYVNFNDGLIIAYAFAIAYTAYHKKSHWEFISQFGQHWISNSDSVPLYEEIPDVVQLDSNNSYAYYSPSGNSWDSGVRTDLVSAMACTSPIAELLIIRFDEISEYVFGLLEDYIKQFIYTDVFTKLNPLVYFGAGITVLLAEHGNVLIMDSNTAKLYETKMVIICDSIEFKLHIDRTPYCDDKCRVVELLESKINRFVASSIGRDQ